MCSTWNIGRGFSPSWRSHFEKSQLSAVSLGGVPVFSRINLKHNFSRSSESSFTAGRSSPPLSVHSLPIQMRQRKVVPEVMTTALEVIFPLSLVVTPWQVQVV